MEKIYGCVYVCVTTLPCVYLQAAAEAARNPHKPQLSARSAAYVPVGPAQAGERLFLQAKQQAAKRELMQKAKAMTDALYDPETGEELFKPRTNVRKVTTSANTSGDMTRSGSKPMKSGVCYLRL